MQIMRAFLLTTVWQSKRHSADAKQVNALKDTEAAVGDRKITANRIKSGRALAREFQGLHVWTPKPLELALH